MSRIGTLTIDGQEYVVIPKAKVSRDGWHPGG